MRFLTVAKVNYFVDEDAHCEVNTNWLPPLLAPIYRDRSTMTVPIIDGIDHKSFEYRPVYGEDRHFRGDYPLKLLKFVG